MSEYEIMYLLSETINRIWEGVMFWVSVTFAYLAASYTVREKLGVFQIFVLSVLYLSFTIHMFSILKLGATLQGGYIQDLHIMLDAGVLKSIAAKNYLIADNQRWDLITQRLCLFGMASVAFLYLPINKFFLVRHQK